MNTKQLTRTTSTTDDRHLSGSDNVPVEIVKLSHPWRLTSAILVAFFALAAIYSIVNNQNFGWDRVWYYLFYPDILLGLGRTLILTAVAMIVGVTLGIVLAAARLSQNKIVSGAAGLYLGFFRGTPLLIQLIFWFNFAALYPTIGIAVPFGGPWLFSAETNTVLTVWFVALLGLSLNEAAYMAEIVRGGLLSVPRTQLEAAQALGLRPFECFRRIVLPQAMRVIIPPTGNQVIGMLKYSSLVSVIALPDLLYSAQLIYSQNYQAIPLLIVVSFWYLLCTSILTVFQRRIEDYYGRGVVSAGQLRPAKASRRAKKAAS